MGKISRIQLRGISRTPSDRMSEDGGLAESLNMYLDTAESAPALVPKDVTTDLGLPADLQAERIFIHKTANYENYIVVQSDRVVAYTPEIEDDEPLLILELEEGEKVNDITSVGNTVIFSSSKSMYYVLYKERKYSLLGNKIYFPKVTFYPKDEKYITKQYRKDWKRGLQMSIPFSERETNGEPKDPSSPLDFGPNGVYYPSDLGVFAFYDIDTSLWNAKNDDGENSDIIVREFLEEREKLVKEMLSEHRASSPFFIRYSIELYDGSELSSIPYVFYPTKVSETFFDAKLEMYYNTSPELYAVYHNGYNLLTISSTNTQTVGIKIDEEEINSSWNDVVKKIKFYISQSLPWDEAPMRSKMETPIPTYKEIEEGGFQPLGGSVYSYKKTLFQQSHINFEQSEDFEDEILDVSSNVFLVKEIEIFHKNSVASFSEDFKELLESGEISIGKYVDHSHEEYVQLEEQPRLNGDDMKHYELLASNAVIFNNRLMLSQPFNVLSYDHARPSAYSTGGRALEYEFIFFIRTNTEDKVIKKVFQLDAYSQNVYAFIIFPDSRAFKAIVKITDTNIPQTWYGEFEMVPHDYLDCSYYYGGLNVRLYDLCNLSTCDEYEINNIEQLDNKLLVSEQDNPFFFPLENRYSFQSKVIGVAIATTTLSQGQFGQFPLAVFTEDGVWFMQVNEEGTMLGSKPKFRDVCINPDSIVSLSDAIVFITSQGVMMIENASDERSAHVVNISPYMNGRHYTPNASAVNLINNQEGFGEFESVITDDDPFMKFMRNAKVAYDYTGQRLIFISKKDGKPYGYQYIYKIDTQTWHKVAFSGFDLDKPINSYPECLVQTQPEQREIQKSVVWFELTSGSIVASVVSAFNSQTNVGLKKAKNFLKEVEPLDKDAVDNLSAILDDLAQEYSFTYSLHEEMQSVIVGFSKIYSLSTVLDASRQQDTAKGILITRPFDLGKPDVFKTITDVRIRGQFPKGAVKFILQASNDWVNWVTISTLRGRAWKLFRIIILADLGPSDRISWVDVMYDTKFTNKLR